VDKKLAEKVAEGLGLTVPAQPEKPMNHGVGADADPNKHEPKPVDKSYQPSDAVSMLKNPTVTNTIETRQVAFLCADGVSETSLNNLKKALEAKGAAAKIIGPHAGNIKTDTGKEIKTDHTFFSSSSVLFDAVYVPGAKNSAALENNDNVIQFINDAYRHCKVIGADAEVQKLLSKTTIGNKLADKKDTTLPGVVMNTDTNFANNFIAQLGKHRIWEREEKIVQ
jgi:catalase